jgi:AmmeMemoRadiSam system protein B
LRAQLGRFFAHEKGSGPPVERPRRGGGRLRGILSPHIDFYRGGPVYSHAYRALVERSDADTFVILGVAHQPCRHRFALTRKDFETPLGLTRNDRAYVDKVAALAGDHLFDDELAHRAEHSIEFQVVFLQYLLGGRREFSIVPILVGSFHDLMDEGVDPIVDDEVRQFVEALRAAESAAGGQVAYIGGIDLCHVGPEFGDPDRLDPATLNRVRAFDQDMLSRAADGDAAGWFGTAARIRNRWRVCGLAATYTMLHAMGPARGRLLKYDQAVDAARTCCVSFASVAFTPSNDGPAADE